MADISFDSAKNVVIKYGFCGECRFTTGDKHCIKMDCYRAVKQLMEAVPVVRCKDCKFQGDEDDCPLLSLSAYTEPDDFCSYGERKDGGNDG